mgnify:CR=1 FL=1
MLKKVLKGIVGYLSKLTVEQEDVVGVDITPNCIRVSQLSSSKKKWSLSKLGYKYIDASFDLSIAYISFGEYMVDILMGDKSFPMDVKKRLAQKIKEAVF